MLGVLPLEGLQQGTPEFTAALVPLMACALFQCAESVLSAQVGRLGGKSTCQMGLNLNSMQWQVVAAGYSSSVVLMGLKRACIMSNSVDRAASRCKAT